MKSRRQFIKLAGTGIASTGLMRVQAFHGLEIPHKKPEKTFTVGFAGYTFKEFNVDQSINIMKRVGINEISIKDFHMPMKSTAEQINAVTRKFRNAGITINAVGVIYMGKGVS